MHTKHELPSGVKDYLPSDSYKIKEIETSILNIFRHWGYDYVITPILEYLPVYANEMSWFPDEELIKVIERETGKTMVLRADFTPQIARIVTSKMLNDIPSRLSYSGAVVKHHADKGKKGIYQAGIELIGANGALADAEVMVIASEVLKQSGITDFVFSISHAGFIKAVLDELNLTQEQTSVVIDMMLKKDYTGINDIKSITHIQQYKLNSLFELYGEPSKILPKAIKIFKNNKIKLYISEIDNLLRIIKELNANGKLILDLRELHSLDYHTGIVFQCFTHGYGEELINGGRYDGFLGTFGYDLPATGFGIDLSALAALIKKQDKSSDTIALSDTIPPKEIIQIKELVNKLGYNGMIYYEAKKSKPLKVYLSEEKVKLLISKVKGKYYNLITAKNTIKCKDIEDIKSFLMEER
ncbi:MAG: ATP phosphoribosyltransferase regulatory subunit [Deltaproteobacteria bacterium]|nr:ATP phosphoribosyltransferase regulatory subunit [Deltaproteobacteria bacterium]MCL5792489.1 ATP phosphoribosyltransferase regulatory subunit [Deltaproteobacteria bacterium]